MKTWAKIWPWEEIEKSLVLLTEEGTEVWVLISMDFIDGLTKSHGPEVNFVVVDGLSMVILFPLKHPYTTYSVAKVFMDYYSKVTWSTRQY